MKSSFSRQQLNVVVCGLALALAACGETGKKADAAQGERALGDQPYLVVEDGGLAADVLSGTGKVAFVSPLPNAATSFALAFTIADKGSLTLVGFAAQGLANGASLKLTREGTTLTAVTNTPKGPLDVSKSFTTLDASGPLSLVIDMHNHEKPAHVLAWVAGDAMNEDTAFFNSDLDGPLTGNGTGRIWGLELVDAAVSSASTDRPKFEH